MHKAETLRFEAATVGQPLKWNFIERMWKDGQTRII